MNRRNFVKSSLATASATLLAGRNSPQARCLRRSKAHLSRFPAKFPSRKSTAPASLITSSGAWPQPPTRSKVHGTSTAKANPTGTTSPTPSERSRAVPLETSPAINTTAIKKTSPSSSASTKRAIASQPHGRAFNPPEPAPRTKPASTNSRLVDALLEAGIRPFCTLYHWDLPQALEDRGGWPNRDLASYYADFAGVLAKHLGDRITVWAPFNMPWTFTYYGYGIGVFPPQRAGFDLFLKAAHTVNLAQGLRLPRHQGRAPQFHRRQRVGNGSGLSKDQ